MRIGSDLRAFHAAANFPRPYPPRCEGRPLIKPVHIPMRQRSLPSFARGESRN
jgi:hypothetical protein